MLKNTEPFDETFKLTEHIKKLQNSQNLRRNKIKTGIFLARQHETFIQINCWDENNQEVQIFRNRKTKILVKKCHEKFKARLIFA